jgi:hypothetical protein
VLRISLAPRHLVTNQGFQKDQNMMPKQESTDIVTTQAITPEVLPTEDTSYPKSESNLAPHWKDFTWRDGVEVLAEAANFIPGAGEAIKATIGLGKFSPEERLKNEQFKWLLERVEQMSKQISNLLLKLPPEKQPEPADVAAVLEAAMEASRKTVGYQKRQLLKNAVVNAFDLEQYEAGLTLRLFSILEKVEYGDVELLYRLANNALERISVQSINTGNSLIFHHLQVLQDLALVMVYNHNPNAPLAIDFMSAHLVVSEIGKRFLKFVAEPEVVDESGEASI